MGNLDTHTSDDKEFHTKPAAEVSLALIINKTGFAVRMTGTMVVIKVANSKI